MQYFLDWLTGQHPYLPSIITITVITLLLIGINRFTLKRLSKNQGQLLRQQLFMITITFIGVISILVSLPISDSIKGQIFSLLGIVVSAAIALSSTTFVGNAMAGLMLTGVKVFKIGDFVRVGDHFGRVSERGLLHVEIQTEDRDLTTLPNLYLVTNPTKVIHAEGTVISAEVSLGYDISRKRIEKHLLAAAELSNLESPFVQVISLGDFSVLYRLSGLLIDVKKIITARSELHKNILDSLQQGGIEIVSPTFMNTRSFNPNHNFIAPSHLSKTEAEIPNEVEIESILFDKAEQAETLSYISRKLKRITIGKEKLITLLENTSNAEEADKLQHRIEHLEAIEAKLANLKSEMNKAQKPKK
ncbi:mechanosensitive ion channel family protein [Alkalimarinus sediminis]|uniref:Small-conductance mechanosensitive channel n=1 Tax=Alkalimarinus sediminis TaxID=1632866 RepID=A0A9E8HUH3_9ALTE|nr:mechanosensitive ion channel domain-containing protein [Alkalimarinus sediminis]UZW76766.1 mechanosensitive ion channel family protein [Alkalimarinus sediminis]